MKHVKFSLINNDFSVEADADIDFHDNQDTKLADFLSRLSEQLVTGETARIEIDGLERPVVFTVAESAL
ncbi:MAG: hypothetical protein ACQERN_14280 [Thermodesulfobacteriota bacterium]